MNVDDPFFSIIVPTYNRAKLIGATLRSLQQIDYSQYEIIVVDDGSTDDTENIVRDFQREDSRIQYVRKQNAERAAARNFGVTLAKGAYVNFFDSDDLAYSNHLRVAAELIIQRKSPEWFHLGYVWLGKNSRVLKSVDMFKGETLNNRMASGNPLSCNGVFIRKDIIEAHPFNEDRLLSASEDYELWCRLAARFPLYYNNTITSAIVEHESRSVRCINGEQLIRRLLLLIQYLEKDIQVLNFFGNDFRKVKMDANSYIAIHLADTPKYKLKSISFLIKSLMYDVSLVRSKRFYAILKNLIIKW